MGVTSSFDTASGSGASSVQVAQASGSRSFRGGGSDANMEKMSQLENIMSRSRGTNRSHDVADDGQRPSSKNGAPEAGVRVAATQGTWLGADGDGSRSQNVCYNARTGYESNIAVSLTDASIVML